MSSTVTLSTGESEIVHGSLVAARAYLAMMPGPQYDAWRALLGSGATADDAQKRTLAAAVRYFNAQTWAAAADTFAERDAIAAFETAQYELAALIAADPSVVALADQGSNIQSVSAGGASVSYFNPTTKNAAKMPPVLMRLVGSYLTATNVSGPEGGSGQTGSCVNPMSECADYDRREPY